MTEAEPFGGSAGDAETVDRLIDVFHRLMMRAHAIDAEPRTFGTGHVLHRAEIHTIQAIGRGDGMIMKDVAEALGVTRGAVSQMAAKLEAKGLVERRPGANKKEIVLALTETGWRGYQAHEDFHRAFLDCFRTQYGAELTAKANRAIDVLAELEAVLEGFVRDYAGEQDRG
ncbi:MarR family transcriptional regulator [Maricaulis sp.]|uniref:MarR family winged helix-turn-helix transcriptional regulator n=1 Tax=Maricaulis sp. TaxID=1486257 RepID=UPI00261EBE26|nr:MarR family transcriptional regulator [Maricaulis sp.]